MYPETAAEETYRALAARCPQMKMPGWKSVRRGWRCVFVS